MIRFPANGEESWMLLQHADSPFSGWHQSQNINPEEGPYPQWHLPRGAYGTFPVGLAGCECTA